MDPFRLITLDPGHFHAALIQKESIIHFRNLKLRFEVSLVNERRLRTLFDLNCDGISKPQELAAQLKLPVRAVENLQKRLRRKWLAFSRNQVNTGGFAGRPDHRNLSTRKEGLFIHPVKNQSLVIIE